MHVSRDELDACALSAANLRRAVSCVRRDAFVVLQGMIAADAVDAARKICASILERKHKDNVPLPYELLRRAPFVEFAAHPIVVQVVQAILEGRGAPQGFRWIRRCTPGRAAVARVHRDVAGLGDGGELPLRLAVDVMLTPFTEDNGATQIWPGTQYTREADVAAHKSVGERAAKLPRLGITGTAGSIAIRDQRAWHRAGVNRTQQDRVMVSMGQWEKIAA